MSKKVKCNRHILRDKFSIYFERNTSRSKSSSFSYNIPRYIRLVAAIHHSLLIENPTGTCGIFCIRSSRELFKQRAWKCKCNSLSVAIWFSTHKKTIFRYQAKFSNKIADKNTGELTVFLPSYYYRKDNGSCSILFSKKCFLCWKSDRLRLLCTLLQQRSGTSYAKFIENTPIYWPGSFIGNLIYRIYWKNRKISDIFQGETFF